MDSVSHPGLDRKLVIGRSRLNLVLFSLISDVFIEYLDKP
jgi:hypothetical protein